MVLIAFMTLMNSCLVLVAMVTLNSLIIVTLETDNVASMISSNTSNNGKCGNGNKSRSIVLLISEAMTNIRYSLVPIDKQ